MYKKPGVIWHEKINAIIKKMYKPWEMLVLTSAGKSSAAISHRKRNDENNKNGDANHNKRNPSQI